MKQFFQEEIADVYGGYSLANVYGFGWYFLVKAGVFGGYFLVNAGVHVFVGYCLENADVFRCLFFLMQMCLVCIFLQMQVCLVGTGM